MSPASVEMLDNLARVRERIETAASRAGRLAEDVTMVAVSKTQPACKIRELYEAGVRHFGENRVQERELKLAEVAGLGINWHMIGHLQKNKAARAVRLFDTIDSLDSVALAERLDQASANFATESVEGTGKSASARTNSERFARANQLRVLIEVKLDAEPAKSGVEVEGLPGLTEAILRLQHLNLLGLMGVPPHLDDPEKVRPFFRRLRELRDGLRAGRNPEFLPVLSMGMSHDFEAAIEEGATEIRVGTALFGARGT